VRLLVDVPYELELGLVAFDWLCVLFWLEVLLGDGRFELWFVVVFWAEHNAAPPRRTSARVARRESTERGVIITRRL
jgi:hypothetical protein